MFSKHSDIGWHWDIFIHSCCYLQMLLSTACILWHGSKRLKKPHQAQKPAICTYLWCASWDNFPSCHQHVLSRCWTSRDKRCVACPRSSSNLACGGRVQKFMHKKEKPGKVMLATWRGLGLLGVPLGEWGGKNQGSGVRSDRGSRLQQGVWVCIKPLPYPSYWPGMRANS